MSKNSLPPTAKVVGLDLGLSTFAALSNGSKLARHRWMKQAEQNIAFRPDYRRLRRRFQVENPNHSLEVGPLLIG
jgi:hypothetical protein